MLENSSLEKPVLVTNAANLFYASIGVGVIKAILDLARVAAGVPVWFTVLTIIVTFGIMIFLIVKISAGRNWARITMLVLFLIGLPFSIPLVLQEFSANFFVAILSIAQIILQAIALVFLFQQPSNAWFKYQKSK